MDEVLFVQRRGNRRERNRRLVVVEAVDDAGGPRVARSEPSKVPVVLDVLHDAAELVIRRRNAAGLCIRRDDDCRHPQARTSEAVLLRADHVVVEAAPVVKHPAPLASISDGIDTPSGACIDGQGTLYVTNQPPSGPGWISEYPLGKTAPPKVIKNGVNTPAFCAIDAKGNLWVTNIGLDDVAEYLKGATKPHIVITSGLAFPVGIAIDHLGNLYVGNGWDASQKNVEVYPPGSESPSRTIMDGITWPVGIAVDSTGTLYVTNAEQNNVEEYHSGQDGPFQTITKAMNSPVDVTVNRKGLLYVTNMGNNTVVEFSPGSLTPSKRQISEGLEDPEGAAHYPAMLP
jgi:hypothetical protein